MTLKASSRCVGRDLRIGSTGGTPASRGAGAHGDRGSARLTSLGRGCCISHHGPHGRPIGAANIDKTTDDNA